MTVGPELTSRTTATTLKLPSVSSIILAFLSISSRLISAGEDFASMSYSGSRQAGAAFASTGFGSGSASFQSSMVLTTGSAEIASTGSGSRI